MRIYITSSFGDSPEEIEKLCAIVRTAGFEDFSFIRDIENYQKIFSDPKELMKQAEAEILKSGILLIDITAKPTGRAIEAGMAYSLNKKIIVILKRGTQIKDTMRGIADLVIEYDLLEDILPGLRAFLQNY
jgi:nucleoside 2-deoxyribosyltransferase